MSNSQKTPFAISVQNFVQDAITDNLQGLGQVLPCSIIKVEGAIVTVNFEIDNEKFTPPPVRCATISSQYIRVPLQVGDKGVCVAANARLGGVNGLGSGVASLVNPSNLGGLVFLPIGNINFEAVDAQANVLIAPNGAVLRTTDNLSNLTVSQSKINLDYFGNTINIDASGITITAQSTTVVINSAGVIISSAGGSITIGGGGVSITGGLSIDGQPYINHIHSGVQTGGGNTGGVV